MRNERMHLRIRGNSTPPRREAGRRRSHGAALCTGRRGVETRELGEKPRWRGFGGKDRKGSSGISAVMGRPASRTAEGADAECKEGTSGADERKVRNKEIKGTTDAGWGRPGDGFAGRQS